MAPNKDVQLADLALRPSINNSREDNSLGDLESVPLLTPVGNGKDATETILVISSEEEKLELKISGMTCSACSNSVEKALMRLDGVLHASVALLQNKANVTFDPARVKVSYLLSCRQSDFILHPDRSAAPFLDPFVFWCNSSELCVVRVLGCRSSAGVVNTSYRGLCFGIWNGFVGLNLVVAF